MMDLYLYHLPGPDPGKYHIQLIVLDGYDIFSRYQIPKYENGF